jgi:hypothetical protein
LGWNFFNISVKITKISSGFLVLSLVGMGMIVLMVAVLSMDMFVAFLGLLFFLFVIRVSFSIATAAHVEVVHVVSIPIFTNWLGFIFFILINPLGPVNLNVSILDFILS